MSVHKQIKGIKWCMKSQFPGFLPIGWYNNSRQGRGLYSLVMQYFWVLFLHLGNYSLMNVTSLRQSRLPTSLETRAQEQDFRWEEGGRHPENPAGWERGMNDDGREMPSFTRQPWWRLEAEPRPSGAVSWSPLEAAARAPPGIQHCPLGCSFLHSFHVQPQSWPAGSVK